MLVCSSHTKFRAKIQKKNDICKYFRKKIKTKFFLGNL